MHGRRALHFGKAALRGCLGRLLRGTVAARLITSNASGENNISVHKLCILTCMTILGQIIVVYQVCTPFN